MASTINTSAASLSLPYGLDVFKNGTLLAVTEHGTDFVRVVEVSSGSVQQTCGSFSTASQGHCSAVGFRSPAGIAVFPGTDEFAVADTDNNLVRDIKFLTLEVSSGRLSCMPLWVLLSGFRDDKARFRRWPRSSWSARQTHTLRG